MKSTCTFSLSCCNTGQMAKARSWDGARLGLGLGLRDEAKARARTRADTYLPLLDHKLKESIWLLELGPPRLSHGQILSPVDLLQLQQREASAITQDTCRASHLFRVEGRRSKLFNTSFPLRCPPMDKYLYLHTHTNVRPCLSLIIVRTLMCGQG